MSSRLIEQAHAYLRAVIIGVPEGSWGSPTPCGEWNVRQVLTHARLGQLTYAAAITGEEGVPLAERFSPADELDADHVDQLDEALTKVTAAWLTVSPDAESVPTPLGPLPPWLAAGACALDPAVHAWDIAVATGQDRPLPAELADLLTPVARRLVDGLRDSYGVYAAALDGSDGRDGAAELLRFLGRDPEWAG